MFRLRHKRLLIGATVIAALLAVALWPATIEVDTAVVTAGPLVVTIDEEGQTRVRDRYVVAAPVAGRVLRIELEPGDRVKAGDIVARVRPEVAPLLDARSRAEAQAAVETANAAVGQARAEQQRARAAVDQAERELARTKELAANELTTARELDARTADLQTAQETLRAAEFGLRAATADLARARVRLTPPSAGGGGDRVLTVTSPVDGVVLKRIRESESVVPAGESLLEIGDPSRLEIVADLLSTDAVRVSPGARAMIEQWGGDRVLDAHVRRVEPSGFTKVSALGVEEQRVNVILDFADPAAAGSALGDAYRVEVRIVTWESPRVVKVPTSALFRVGEQWALYTVADGRARQTIISIGHQTADEAEVLDGVSEGTPVIVYPGDTLSDAARVRPRP
jgi:HlyD family secretion protein